MKSILFLLLLVSEVLFANNINQTNNKIHNTTIVIGVDMSASTPFDNNSGNQAYAIDKTVKYINNLELKKGDLIVIKGFGEYSSRIKKSPITHEYIVRKTINKDKLKGLIQKVFNFSEKSQGSTNILAFLEIPPLPDPKKPLSHIILITDGFETSSYGKLKDFEKGKKLPTDADELNGVSILFVGFGMESSGTYSPKTVKVMKKVWKDFAKSTGAVWLRPITW